MFRLCVILVSALLASPALAQDGVNVVDAYARVATESAKSAAAFFVIENQGPTPDRLLNVTADIAERAELHSNSQDANGVMSMARIEGGIAIPANGSHTLDRAGDHLMLMGLTRGLRQGDVIRLTLTFERQGEMVVEVPVDNDRAPGAAPAMDHTNMQTAP